MREEPASERLLNASAVMATDDEINPAINLITARIKFVIIPTIPEKEP